MVFLFSKLSLSSAGFPNKLAYPEFKARYNSIGAAAVAKAKNDKAAGQAVMDIVKVSQRCLNSMNVQN